MPRETFAYLLFALFVIYFVWALSLFVLSITCFARALGHGDATKLPKHLSFNPLNVLINASSLDKDGIKLRNKGCRYLIYFFAMTFCGIVIQSIGQFFVNPWAQ
jgi:hypothetical protein